MIIKEKRKTVSNPAGFWVRFVACILDFLIIGIPLSYIGYLISGSWEGDPTTSTVNFLYTLLLPVLWSGYTVGKKILGIRIAKENGEKLGIGAMLLRNILGGFIYIVTLGIGLIVSAFMVGLREDKRAIHDLIAGTYVTYNSPGDEEDFVVNE